MSHRTGKFPVSSSREDAMQPEGQWMEFENYEEVGYRFSVPAFGRLTEVESLSSKFGLFCCREVRLLPLT